VENLEKWSSLLFPLGFDSISVRFLFYLERSYIVKIRRFANINCILGMAVLLSLVVIPLAYAQDPFEPDDTMAQANQQALNSSTDHDIGPLPNDQDWISFDLEKKATDVSITTTLGTLLDSVIWLYDSAGNEIAYNDDYMSLASRIDISLGAGTYYVKIESFAGLFTGSYSIAVEVIHIPNGIGAEKADMYDYFAGANIGGANFNINANNVLIITVHVNKGVPDDVTDMGVSVFDKDYNTYYSNIFASPFLSLNGQGSGEVQVKIPLDIPADYPYDDVSVYIDCLGMYSIYGIGNPVSVPLKK